MLPRSWRASPAVRQWADPIVLKLKFKDHADFSFRRRFYSLLQSLHLVWRKLSRSWHAMQRLDGLRAPLLAEQRPVIRVVPLGDRAEFVDPFATNNALLSMPTLETTRPPAPVVSVIIAAHNGLALTLDCLAAIAAAGPKTPAEIIVIDDASSDDTRMELSKRCDIRYMRNQQNIGFLDSCNIGAAAARGRHLMFLNNDAVLTPGSLDFLVETLDRDSCIGIVGGKLLFPNGRLQEAGAITWADATGANWGRGQDPDDPRFGFSRPVDYVSGCAMMMPKSLFMAVGGFDLRFRPAYYEDTDIAFEVRALGLDVAYQPYCRIVHHEGMSYGSDTRSAKISHMERNRRQFREKWSAVLPLHGSSNAPPRNFADRKPVGRALIIDASTPTPDRDSGSLDMINLMRILIELGYRITFVPGDNFARLGAYTEKLENMGIECICAPYETSVHGLVTKRGDVFDLIVLSRRNVAAGHFKTVREACPSARVVFNLVDLHYLREERAAALEGMAGNETARNAARKLELDLASAADAAITVSSFEAELLRRERPTARVVTIPVIRDIPGRAGGVAGRRDILFIGGFDHPPNADAVAWFVSDILPRIRRDLNDISFHIVGSKMPASIASLGVPLDRKGPVLIHGHVEDLTPLFASIRLTVAPLRYGAGIKGKIATSFCHGVPCVATTIAVEGSNLVPGKDILVADDAEEFAQAVVRLCRDDALWETLSDAGLAAADAQFSLPANRDRVARLLTDIQAPAFLREMSRLRAARQLRLRSARSELEKPNLQSLWYRCTPTRNGDRPSVLPWPQSTQVCFCSASRHGPAIARD